MRENCEEFSNEIALRKVEIQKTQEQLKELQSKFNAALEAARSAGATGATIFHTHSVDNAKIEQAMGASIPADSDSIFFLTTKEYKLKIMEAIRDSAGLKTEGSAVIFSIPVDDLVGIGRFDEQMVEE